MFNVAELDRMVCMQLSRHDLLHCTLVNSVWYDAAMPYLWTDLSNLTTVRQQQALRKLVLIDYIQERQRLEQKQLQEEAWIQDGAVTHSNGSNGPTITEDIYCPSLLEEYGVNVVHIPPLDDLLSQALPQHQDPCTAFTQCLQWPDSFVAITFPYLVPAAQALQIGASTMGHYCLNICASEMDQILKIASDRLESLTLGVSIEGQWDMAWDYETGFVGLRELILYDVGGTSEFWSILWEGCRRIVRLQVHQIVGHVLHSLVAGIRKHMTHLDSIKFGARCDDPFSWYQVDDEKAAKLIDAGTKGWRVVESDMDVVFGPRAMTSLTQHYSTLVEIRIVQCVGGSSVPDLLALCPNLQTMVSSDTRSIETEQISTNPALNFIDWDPITNSLRPWACESCLKTLVMRITDIPLQENEAYPGQRENLHTGVYSRLARLTQLEELSLGHPLVGRLHARHIPFSLTVASGLAKLAGLKKMRILRTDGLNHDMSKKDLEWILQNWPNWEY
ncbi:hypothetical protein MVEG_11353 [Podila verticillata NRRL 6337]|uniref:F-box domain-containing protein n=1 Tax=Podila verticillata NRRL 6337 TaxID=1069443 RepID=A0A086TLK1_9FUNG|nr:hypothetical protein MVEG_11353 [Podila verticillata NRRL 6337]